MGSRKLTHAQTAAFRRMIWRHYRRAGRDLPWRKTHHPYRILVSEIMLQQTQVDRVIPKYKQFLKSYPTIQSLAAAPVRDVLAAWQGLGYNRRALALKRAAQAIATQHRGRVPSTAKELIALPGIGPYTAAAVLALAFNKPTVLLETNIRSVFIHHFFPQRSPELHVAQGHRAITDKQLLPLIEQTIDRRRPAAWYHALMDYGAALKKQHANPSRHSAHYTKPTAFSGSHRQLRGRIIALLTQHRALTASALSRHTGRSVAVIRAAARQLEGEGFILQEGKSMRLAA